MMPSTRSPSFELRSTHCFNLDLDCRSLRFNALNLDHPKGVEKNNRPSPYSKGKSGKAGGKSSGKTSGKVTWITETVINGNKKQLCMRYQTGKCDMGSQCRFHHGCAFPTANGEACNKSHGALMHDRTPH